MELFNPELIIHYGGLTLLLAIIFIETGIFFGFLLPGDSLLFMAGLLSGTEYLEQHIVVVITLLIVAAVSGTTVGYFFGKWSRNRLHTIRDNFFYKKRYLDMAHDFYEKHGMYSFVVGRFLPVFRTFIPILAGVVNIPFQRFFLFNVVGAVLWIVTMVSAGHFLSRIFPSIVDYIEFVVIGMIVITTIPVIMAFIKRRRV